MNSARTAVPLAIVSLTLACGDGPSAPPTVLATSAPITLAAGVRVVADTVVVYMGYTNVDGDAQQMLLDHVRLPADAADTVIVADPHSLEFSEFRTAMRDGTDQRIAIGARFHPDGGGAQNFFMESDLYAGRPGPGPDFSGLLINRVEFHVDTVIVDTPGDDPNGDGVWTNYTVVGSVVVLGYQ